MPDEISDDLLQRKRKRQVLRAVKACRLCRAKKYKCDELVPCTKCQRFRVDCIYDGDVHLERRLPKTNEPHNPGDKFMRLSLPNTDARSTEPTLTTSSSNTPTHIECNRGDARIPHQVVNVPAENEVAGIENHTRDLEYHGQTSTVAFLAALQSDIDPHGPLETSTMRASMSNGSLVSALHNDTFSPMTAITTVGDDSLLRAERFYFKQSRVFLEGHFRNIHFVHPIVRKATFFDRCEDLWFGRYDQQPQSFVALYYSIMSLGALVCTWDEGETIDGMGRLAWSRKMFQLADLAVLRLRLSIDLETIQCYFFLAKVCQNELNLSLAYVYLGLASRMSFAAGINRQQFSVGNNVAEEIQAIRQRTWWGLYALEIELSFALGRPDSLGLDRYHDQLQLAEDGAETAIIPALVYIARIIRRVSTCIYLSKDSLDIMLNDALLIEKDLDSWLLNLPDSIRPGSFSNTGSSEIVKQPLWSKLQQLTVQIRYHNVKMILLRPFLARSGEEGQCLPHVLADIIHRCIDAGRATILHMHDIYINQPFFRTWWYNTTYILYATSIVLWYTMNAASADEVPGLLDLGDKAVAILDAMQESIVAGRACRLIKQVVMQAREKFSVNFPAAEDSILQTRSGTVENTIYENLQADAGGVSLQQMGLNLDFFDLTFPTDEMQSAFWTEFDVHST